ncbi:MAG: hypothetical protein FWE21_06265 [Defluviitaleaceae bacterium]|nr:hypothetical protein [Defluviitaleaceae bacterium]
MQNAVWVIQFKLKKGVTAEEFLTASQKCQDEVISQQKGYLSWKQLVDGDTWIDVIEWQTREDADAALTAGASNPAAQEFYAKMNINSVKHQTLSVAKVY